MGDWDWELIETKKWTKSQIKSDTKLRSEDVILELEEKTAKQRIKEEFVFCGDELVDEEAGWQDLAGFRRVQKWQ